MASAFPTRYSSSSDEHRQKGSSTQRPRSSTVERGSLQCSEQQRTTDDKQSKIGKISYPSSSGFPTGMETCLYGTGNKESENENEGMDFALYHLRLERHHTAVGIARIRVSIWMLCLPLQKCKSRPLHRANSLPKTDRVSQKFSERQSAVSPKSLGKLLLMCG